MRQSPPRDLTDVAAKRRSGVRVALDEFFHLSPNIRIDAVLGEIPSSPVRREISYSVEDFIDLSSHTAQFA
jgi:hypothetical protein